MGYEVELWWHWDLGGSNDYKLSQRLDSDPGSNSHASGYLMGSGFRG